MEFMKKLRRGYYLNNLIALVCVFVSVSCLLVLLLSILRLPDIPLERRDLEFLHPLKFGKRSNEEGRLGELGKRMVAMLPDDLAFTVFVPSEKAFERDLKLLANDSLGQQKENDTFAILSRVLGFSAVPRHLPSVAVPLDGEISFDSVSGFRLDATRVSGGTLVVNTVPSERLDLSKGEIIIHIMTGVIMDAEFAVSFLPDYDNED